MGDIINCTKENKYVTTFGVPAVIVSDFYNNINPSSLQFLMRMPWLLPLPATQKVVILFGCNFKITTITLYEKQPTP